MCDLEVLIRKEIYICKSVKEKSENFIKATEGQLKKERKKSSISKMIKLNPNISVIKAYIHK